MILHNISQKELIEECKKRNIKVPNTVYRWLKRNEGKNIDDFIAYRKSKPNAHNSKVCKDNELSYNNVIQWVNRKEGRTAEDYINRPPFLTQLCKTNGIKYANAERWLLRHPECSFNDYVRYLNNKAYKKAQNVR